MGEGEFRIAPTLTPALSLREGEGVSVRSLAPFFRGRGNGLSFCTLAPFFRGRGMRRLGGREPDLAAAG